MDEIGFKVMFGVLTGISWVFCLALGWGAKTLISSVRELERDVSKLRELIARDYVSYDRLKESLKPVFDILSEIKTKLDQKADKD